MTLLQNINNGLIIYFFFATRSRRIIVPIYRDLSRRVFSLTRYVSKCRDKILYRQDRILSRYKRVSSAATPCVKLRSYASRQLLTAIFQNCNVRRSSITNIIYVSPMHYISASRWISMLAANWSKLEKLRLASPNTRKWNISISIRSYLQLLWYVHLRRLIICSFA